jgi:hypothetical protein
MDDRLTRRPEGIELNALSDSVFVILARYTAFPWPVMFAQCKRIGADPARLTVEQLQMALPFIVHGVARFTDPLRAERAGRELAELTKQR